MLLVSAESISRSLPGAARPVSADELATVVAALDGAVAGEDPVAVPRLAEEDAADGDDLDHRAGRATRSGSRPAGCTTCSTSSARPSWTSGG